MRYNQEANCPGPSTSGTAAAEELERRSSSVIGDMVGEETEEEETDVTVIEYNPFLDDFFNSLDPSTQNPTLPDIVGEWMDTFIIFRNKSYLSLYYTFTFIIMTDWYIISRLNLMKTIDY